MTGRQVQPRNYPVTQQTGRQGELWVESFFTDAGWTVGTYHIDDGYDLFVTPPRAEFDGQSFLVQVKGKAKRQKRGVVAPVSRKRLRDYAANVTPVFIFRVFIENRSAFWIHAQSVIRQAPRLATGKGDAQVPLPTANEVRTIEEFTEAVRDILLPLHRRSQGIAEVIAARSTYLSALDETMDVSVSPDGTIEFAEAAGKKCAAEVTATFSGQDLAAMEDLIHYGQSATVTSDAVVFHGSAVFAELGLTRPSPATLEVAPGHSQECKVKLRTEKSVLSFGADILIPCRLYRGTKGFTIESTSAAPLRIRIRADLSDGSPTLKMNLQLPESLADGEQLALKPIAAEVGEWAARTAAKSHLVHGEIVQDKRTVRFDALFDGEHELLYVLALLGKLHHIARIFNSSYSLTPDFHYSKRESWLIDAVYRMLRGEKVNIMVSAATVQGALKEDRAESTDYQVPFILPLRLGGQLVCTVPLLFDLRGYARQPLGANGETVLIRSSQGSSSMSLGDPET